MAVELDKKKGAGGKGGWGRLLAVTGACKWNPNRNRNRNPTAPRRLNDALCGSAAPCEKMASKESGVGAREREKGMKAAKKKEKTNKKPNSNGNDNKSWLRWQRGQRQQTEAMPKPTHTHTGTHWHTHTLTHTQRCNQTVNYGRRHC